MLTRIFMKVWTSLSFIGYFQNGKPHGKGKLLCQLFSYIFTNFVFCGFSHCSRFYWKITLIMSMKVFLASSLHLLTLGFLQCWTCIYYVGRISLSKYVYIWVWLLYSYILPTKSSIWIELYIISWDFIMFSLETKSFH